MAKMEIDPVFEKRKIRCGFFIASLHDTVFDGLSGRDTFTDWLWEIKRLVDQSGCHETGGYPSL